MSWQPLFFTDPERFWKILFNQDDAARCREHRYVQDVLFGEVVRFGYFNYPEMAAPLRQLYDYMLEHGMEIDTRLEIYHHVFGMVANTKIVSAGALTPFFCLDPERSVASTAALDYVSHAPLVDDDEMSRPKELIGLIEDGEIRNSGAVFGALLVLGDPRVCKLLWPLKDQLSYEEANEAAQCTTGFVSAATIEFVLDWMEGIEGTGEDALFGSLASHLLLQRRHTQVAFVATGGRPFPAAGATDEELSAMRNWIPAEDYIGRVAPRMLALERTEPEPKVMPLVLDAWGIGSTSSRG